MAYESARDLPTFLEMERQLTFLRLFARAEANALERQIRELAGTVDAFYALLSSKNWIFHDSLSVGAVQRILESAKDDADQAEAMLIEQYNNSERLFFLILPLRKLPAMRRRLPLIEKAREDYFTGRYYSCVHVLLSVMDGFVNEFETVRRGLHARAPEDLDAWDSVVGHHLGLKHAHRTFTKSRSATREDPVHELYRNGIVHGSILNYDNITVATKAWNRLFAVADWARSREAQLQHKPAEKTTWSGVAKQFTGIIRDLAEQTKIDRVNQAWTPRTLLPDSDDFTGHPVRERTAKLLHFWTRRNYGSMSDLLTHSLHAKHGKAVRSEIRRAYENFPLADFAILAISHDMPAACTASVRLGMADSDDATAALRWIREDTDAYPKPEPWAGDWRLATWQPVHLLTPQGG
ncbi:hypothetical protein [Yinghuangia aomiensis]